MDYSDIIRKQIEALGINGEPAEFLMVIWRVTQFFDDVADGDTVSRETLDAALWDCLIGLNSNGFFIARRAELLPVMAVQLLKWQASDKAERDGRADAKSFMWRAGYYDLVLFVNLLCNGPDAPIAPLSLYGETLSDYLKEFPHA